ncbi:MAG TPA: YncE family protein [Trueperaceae bacterium]|nr:YncE family protein [Trueperaceae bacterium]
MNKAAVVLALAALSLPVGARSEVGVGELLIVDKSAGQLVRLDLSSGTVTARVDVGFGPHEVVSIAGEDSPTGTPLAVVSLYGTGPRPGSAIALVDLTSGAVSEVGIAPFTRPHGLAHVPGTFLVLVTVEAQDSLVVVDISGGALASSVAIGSSTPHMVVAAPDGTAGYVSAIAGGSVARVAVPGNGITTASVGPGAEGIALAGGGTSLWVGSNDSNSVYVLDAQTLGEVQIIQTCGVPIRVTSVGVGLMAATCMNDAQVQFFDVDTFDLVSTVTLPGATGRPVGTLASPDGAWLYVATTADGRVHEIDVAAGIVTRSFDVGVEPDGLAFGPGAY